MSVLDAIIERKKGEVALLEAPSRLGRSERSFVEHLRSLSPALVAEVKPKSPSEGVIVDRARVPEIVSVYDRHAQAISVLCDEEDFGGGYDLLEEVRGLTDLPLLAKEFIIDPVQVRRARSAGADAILLIAVILSREDIERLAECSLDLGMSILLELHDESEMGKVPDLPPSQLVLGINNRNLSNLSVDLTITERLALLLRQRYPEHLLLSESGVGSRKDVMQLARVVDGFLIGTTFLKAEDVGEKIRELFPRA